MHLHSHIDSPMRESCIHFTKRNSGYSSHSSDSGSHSDVSNGLLAELATGE